MTSYLLDTNAFSMALTDDPRLPERAQDRMREADRLAVSVISLYEIGLKVRLAKWPEMAAYVGSLEQRADSDGYDLIPLTAAACLDASMLDWDHRNPFDRMIAAVARLESLPVISSDQAFDKIGVERHWTT
ncbi:MAG: type II toxin-antitoxin system VapC family toxin [Boseongicola sp.]|nr:type II toxin-antitoxin system VapC family toxin [Boseongicola sp.]